MFVMLRDISGNPMVLRVDEITKVMYMTPRTSIIGVKDGASCQVDMTVTAIYSKLDAALAKYNGPQAY